MKKCYLILFLWLLSGLTYATSFITITPNVTQLAILPNTSYTLTYQVSNNTTVTLTQMTIASLNTRGQGLSIASNNCATLAPHNTCQFTVTIPARPQPARFTIAPELCISQGSLCAKTASNQVVQVTLTTPHAFVGLANGILPITLVTGTSGTIGHLITGFLLSEPAGIAINSSGSMAYVTDTGHNAVKVINVATNSVINTILVGNVPAAITISPDDTTVYVVNYNDGQFNGTLNKINTSNNQVIGSPIAVGNGPWGITLSPDGATLLVTNSFDNTMSVINAATGITEGVLSIDGSPLGVAVSSDEQFIAVSTVNNSLVTLFNNNLEVLGSVTVSGIPKGLVFSPDNQTLYAVSSAGYLYLINPADGSLRDSFFIEPGLVGIAVTKDGRQLYATSDQASAVAMIDTTSHQVNLIDVGAVQLTLGTFIG